VKTVLGLAIATLTVVRQEPAPRRLTSIPLKVTADLGTVSGARELKDGRILISDAKKAAVFIIDPKAGTTQQIGSAGGGETQYAQPGGFYSGVADTIYLLDRGQARVSVISPSGAIVGTRSIRRKGFSGSSAADLDFQQVDAHGLSYSLDRGGRLAAMLGGTATDSAPLIRLDPVRQHVDTVAQLRQPEKKVIQADEHTQMTREIRGSPRDGWGVAADGSVAVVRASPYRIDWYSPAGKVSRGPVISFEPIAFTAEEKAALKASRGPSVGVAAVGEEKKSAPSGDEDLFAPAKTAFDPASIIVSSDGHVWVPRNQSFGAKTVLYDVFDRQGQRVDRVELPPGNWVIGFGANAIYAVERDDKGSAALRKYKL
jgi:hypothetical protein